jgi:tetratricopeptide (TPR) repeat protein
MSRRAFFKRECSSQNSLCCDALTTDNSIIAMCCIALVFYDQKQLKKAALAYQYAIQVARLALGQDHIEIAVIYNKLGNVLYEMGSYEESLKAYQEGLEVELKVVEPENCRNIAITMSNIAEIYKEMKEFNMAQSFFLRTLHLQRTSGAEPLDIASTLQSIGIIYHMTENYEESMDIMQECLQIRRDALGENHESIANCLTHIALCLLRLSKFSMCLDVLSEVYRVRMVLKGSEMNRETAFTIYNIGLIHHHQGDAESALIYYLRAEYIETKVLGPTHHDVAITLFNIAQILYRCGDLDRSLSYYQRSLDIERESLGEADIACARTLLEMGNIELLRGNVHAVMYYFPQSFRIYSSNEQDFTLLRLHGIALWRFEVVCPPAAASA